MMLTFNEFLIQFSEEVGETYAMAEMSRNAKIAVVSVMRQYLGNRRFDPTELLSLFQTVCMSAMHKGSVAREAIAERFNNEVNTYLTEEPRYASNPEISLEEVEERRSMGR